MLPVVELTVIIGIMLNFDRIVKTAQLNIYMNSPIHIPVNCQGLRILDPLIIRNIDLSRNIPPPSRIRDVKSLRWTAAIHTHSIMYQLVPTAKYQRCLRVINKLFKILG